MNAEQLYARRTGQQRILNYGMKYYTNPDSLNTVTWKEKDMDGTSVLSIQQKINEKVKKMIHFFAI